MGWQLPSCSGRWHWWHKGGLGWASHPGQCLRRRCARYQQNQVCTHSGTWRRRRCPGRCSWHACCSRGSHPCKGCVVRTPKGDQSWGKVRILCWFGWTYCFVTPCWVQSMSVSVLNCLKSTHFLATVGMFCAMCLDGENIPAFWQWLPPLPCRRGGGQSSVQGRVSSCTLAQCSHSDELR